MIIAFVITFVLCGGIALIVMYQSAEEKIYNEVQYVFDNYKSPADDLKLEDYKNVKEYAKASQEVEKVYEDTVFQEIGKRHNKTGEEVKKIYMEQVVKQMK